MIVRGGGTWRRYKKREHATRPRHQATRSRRAAQSRPKDLFRTLYASESPTPSCCLADHGPLCKAARGSTCTAVHDVETTRDELIAACIPADGSEQRVGCECECSASCYILPAAPVTARQA